MDIFISLFFLLILPISLLILFIYWVISGYRGIKSYRQLSKQQRNKEYLERQLNKILERNAEVKNGK